MKLTFGKSDRKLRRLRDRAITRLHSHLSRKMRLLFLLKEDIVMETWSVREIFFILPNSNLGNA
jgi:hypothetical protein